MRLPLAILVSLAFCIAGCGDAAPAETMEEQGICGDGVQGPTELCDSGALNSDTAEGACRTDCTPSRCGDGVLDPGEECDGTSGCTADCQWPPLCGNGFVEAGEECDDDTAWCSDTCTRVPYCGDGVVDVGEECDDGNFDSDDGCSDSCAAEEESVCGDGIVSGSEECDDGNLVATDSCTERCFVARCGDSRVHLGVEECDNGPQNGAAAYQCNVECQVPRCGDGIVDPEETCDDGVPVSAECELCGTPPSNASLVNLLTDGREVSILQDGVAGPVTGPVGSLSAVVGSPVLAGPQSVDLLLSDGTLLEGIETEHGMGPGDHYTFVVIGFGDDVQVRVVREVNSPPPGDEVRLRVLNGLAGEEYPVSLQERAPDSRSEYLLFVALFGEITLDLTRPPGELEVVLTIHAETSQEFEFDLGRSELGVDSSIYISGTSEAPVIIRTSTSGDVRLAEGERVLGGD